MRRVIGSYFFKGNGMKKLILGLCICGISALSFGADTLPKFYDNLVVTGIESWPDAGDPTYGFMVRIDGGLSTTGCGSNTVFSVKSGDFQDASLSLLLTALASDKKIKVRVLHCTDRPIVDRVELKK